MSKTERIFGIVMASLIGLIFIVSAVSSLLSILKGDLRGLGGYGPYKASVEYEEADSDF